MEQVVDVKEEIYIGSSSSKKFSLHTSCQKGLVQLERTR